MIRTSPKTIAPPPSKCSTDKTAQHPFSINEYKISDSPASFPVLCDNRKSTAVSIKNSRFHTVDMDAVSATIFTSLGGSLKAHAMCIGSKEEKR